MPTKFLPKGDFEKHLLKNQPKTAIFTNLTDKYRHQPNCFLAKLSKLWQIFDDFGKKQSVNIIKLADFLSTVRKISAKFADLGDI